MHWRKAKRVRIYVGEGDKVGSLPLHLWLVREARAKGLSGATVIRGIEGFGSHGELHATRVLRLFEDLPLIVELVDDAVTLNEFLREHSHALAAALITAEDVEIGAVGE